MHTKQAFRKLSRARLILALLSALTMLRLSNPKAYSTLEGKLFKVKHVRASKSRKSKRKQSKRKKHSGKKRRGNPRAKKAMLYMRKHKVSLKEAWKHV